MRLLTKITALYLLITLMVFAIGSVIAFQVTKEEIDREHQRFLRRRLMRTMELIEQGEKIQNYDGEKLKVVPLGPNGAERSYHFSDTLVWHPYLKRMENHYKVNAIRKINGQYYYLETFDVIIESDDITETVTASLVRIFLLLLLAVGLLGGLLSARIFRPFNRTLDRIRNFRVQDQQPLELPKTNTREFKRLNELLEQMANKSRRDYQSLKEFSENASHEIQTPLAIAGGKLELLLDSPDLKDKDMQQVLAAQQSIRKLSKLGRSLSLLTKIENEEFKNSAKIDFSQLLHRNLNQFDELISLRNLHLESSIEEDVEIRIDPVLADVMLTNLLQNAVRHNIQGGCIQVVLEKNGLTISNTGMPPTVPPEQLFQRFRKDQQSGQSLGLGLAIVQRICELNHLEIDYRFENERHVVNVRFPKTF